MIYWENLFNPVIITIAVGFLFLLSIRFLPKRNIQQSKGGAK